MHVYGDIGVVEHLEDDHSEYLERNQTVDHSALRIVVSDIYEHKVVLLDVEADSEGQSSEAGDQRHHDGEHGPHQEDDCVEGLIVAQIEEPSVL